MEEPEDMNEFGPLDCAGAVLMMGIVPAVMCYVFGDKNVVLAGLIMGVTVILSAVIWAVAALTRRRWMSRLLNWLGVGLTVFYWVVSICLWTSGAE